MGPSRRSGFFAALLLTGALALDGPGAFAQSGANATGQGKGTGTGQGNQYDDDTSRGKGRREAGKARVESADRRGDHGATKAPGADPASDPKTVDKNVKSGATPRPGGMAGGTRRRGERGSAELPHASGGGNRGPSRPADAGVPQK